MRKIIIQGSIAIFILILGCAVAGAAVSEKAAESFKKGRALQKAGEYQEALEAYKAAIAKNPRFYQALLGLGSVNYSLGNYDEAAARFGAVARMFPDDVRSHLYLAYTYLHLDKYKEAKDIFQRILVENPHLTPALIGLGWAELMIGERFTAESHFKEALKLQPDNDSLERLYNKLKAGDAAYFRRVREKREQKLVNELQDAVAKGAMAYEVPPPGGITPDTSVTPRRADGQPMTPQEARTWKNALPMLGMSPERVELGPERAEVRPDALPGQVKVDRTVPRRTWADAMFMLGIGLGDIDEDPSDRGLGKLPLGPQ